MYIRMYLKTTFGLGGYSQAFGKLLVHRFVRCQYVVTDERLCLFVINLTSHTMRLIRCYSIRFIIIVLFLLFLNEINADFLHFF